MDPSTGSFSRDLWEENRRIGYIVSRESEQEEEEEAIILAKVARFMILFVVSTFSRSSFPIFIERFRSSAVIIIIISNYFYRLCIIDRARPTLLENV